MTDSVVLPPDTTTPASARRLVNDVLSAVDPDVRDIVRLLTSELVTNVVRHAETEVRLTIAAGPPIRVEVHDGQAASDAFREAIGTRPATPDSHALGGRGLAFVHELASRLGLDDDPGGGKVVWFELDV